MSILPTDRNPIQLHTPLGDDILFVERLSGREALSEPFQFRLEMIADRSARVPFEDLLGQPTTLVLDYPGRPPRTIHGIIRWLRAGKSDDAWKHYEALVVPAFWRLTQRSRSRIFQHQSIPEILREVLQGVPAVFHLADAYPKIKFCAQYCESDFAFASRLMEQYGIYYYFEHSHDAHTMVLADDSVRTQPLVDLSEIPFDSAVGSSISGRIFDWSKAQGVGSSTYSARDYTVDLPRDRLEGTQGSLAGVRVGAVDHVLNAHFNSDLFVHDYPGDYAHLFDSVSAGGADQPNAVPLMLEQRNRLLTVRSEELAADSLRTEGASDLPHLLPGHGFKLRGHDDGDGEYLVRSVEHVATNRSFRADRQAPADCQNTFTALPAALSFRPKRITPRSRIEGPQTATVVGLHGDSIHTDKYGRIKVQFHWDRHGKFDADSSCWVRVGQQWAGKGFGFHTVPRVGQEVIVEFLNGNPDCPIVTGSLANADNMPPQSMPQFKHRTFIKSQSVPMAADDASSAEKCSGILMDDTMGAEHVVVHSEHNRTDSTEGQHFVNAALGHHTHVGMLHVHQVGGWASVDHARGPASKNWHVDALPQRKSSSSGSGAGGADDATDVSDDNSHLTGEAAGEWGTSMSLTMGLASESTMGSATKFVLGTGSEYYFNPPMLIHTSSLWTGLAANFIEGALQGLAEDVLQDMKSGTLSWSTFGEQAEQQLPFADIWDQPSSNNSSKTQSLLKQFRQWASTAKQLRDKIKQAEAKAKQAEEKQQQRELNEKSRDAAIKYPRDYSKGMEYLERLEKAKAALEKLREEHAEYDRNEQAAKEIMEKMEESRPQFRQNMTEQEKIEYEKNARAWQDSFNEANKEFKKARSQLAERDVEVEEAEARIEHANAKIAKFRDSNDDALEKAKQDREELEKKLNELNEKAKSGDSNDSKEPEDLKKQISDMERALSDAKRNAQVAEDRMKSGERGLSGKSLDSESEDSEPPPADAPSSADMTNTNAGYSRICVGSHTEVVYGDKFKIHRGNSPSELHSSQPPKASVPPMWINSMWQVVQTAVQGLEPTSTALTQDVASIASAFQVSVPTILNQVWVAIEYSGSLSGALQAAVTAVEEQVESAVANEVNKLEPAAAAAESLGVKVKRLYSTLTTKYETGVVWALDILTNLYSTGIGVYDLVEDWKDSTHTCSNSDKKSGGGHSKKDDKKDRDKKDDKDKKDKQEAKNGDAKSHDDGSGKGNGPGWDFCELSSGSGGSGIVAAAASNNQPQVLNASNGYVITAPGVAINTSPSLEDDNPSVIALNATGGDEAPGSVQVYGSGNVMLQGGTMTLLNLATSDAETGAVQLSCGEDGVLMLGNGTSPTNSLTISAESNILAAGENLLTHNEDGFVFEAGDTEVCITEEVIELSIGSATITMTEDSITLEAGGASLVLSSEGITMEGPIVSVTAEGAVSVEADAFSVAADAFSVEAAAISLA